ncbi:MAG: NAD(P)/FAD-dependent oxidoreductase, partial [Magnetospirillum sp.]|nr:NAD(P)/FAD-dependent oxidoreductase [Magnetospirillum sp.]
MARPWRARTETAITPLMPYSSYDVIVIGAGAAGLMAAAVAGQRGRRVLVLDHNEKPG